MLGSCTVCLGLSGSGSHGGVSRCLASPGPERYASRGLSCRGHVRCSKEWIGSRGVLWRVPLWNGAVLQSCLGSDSHCMYGYGSHGVEVEDRQVRSMQGRARCAIDWRVLAVMSSQVAVMCAMDWRGLFRQSRCVLLRFAKLGHARER